MATYNRVIGQSDTTTLVTDPPEPVHILVLTTDDGARYPMDYAPTMQNGPRAGELTRKQTKERILDIGTNFLVARTDHCPCSPGRAAYMCGLRSINHFNDKVQIPDYYSYVRDGVNGTHIYDGSSRWPGPIERDHALIAVANFASVNQAAAAWASGTAYVAGDQVAKGGRFYIALASSTNKDPASSANKAQWQDYGTIAASVAMDAQTSTAASGQPWAGKASGARRTVGCRGDGGPDGTVVNDDLQLTGGWPTWARHAGAKVYGFEKIQNGLGVTTVGGTYSVDDPLTTAVDYWISGHSYTTTVPDVVAYNAVFYTCISNVSGSTAPNLDPTHWSAGGTALTTRAVPPAWHGCCFSGDDNQDHYRYNYIEYSETTAGAGTNPETGLGQIGRRALMQYDWPIASLAYNSGTNLVTATTQSPVDGITPGETLTVSVDSLLNPAFNMTAGGNWVEPEVTATAVSSTVFTFTPTLTPSGTSPSSVTSANLYVRRLFQTRFNLAKHLATLASLNVNDSHVVYHGFHMPHASITNAGGAGRNSNDVQAERRYENSLYTANDGTQAWCWGGVQGTGFATPSVGPDVILADAVESPSLSHPKHQTWYQRMNMFASQDDEIGEILDAWDAKFGPDGYYVILCDDNGFQYGGHGATETDSWSPVGGKQYLWENSCRVTIAIRGPGFGSTGYGATSTRLVELADIPMTILDLLSSAFPSLANHHAHTKRDGTSIIRKLNGEQTGMHQFVRGMYLQATLDGGGGTLNHQKVVDKDGNTLVRRSDGSHVQMFLGGGTNSGEPDPAEYETVDHQSDNAGTVAQTTALGAKLDALIVGRWEPSSGAHTGKI